MDHPQHLPFIEFCAGGLGLSGGVSRVEPSLFPVAFSEIEAYAVANLVAKMEAGVVVSAPVWADLKTFPSAYFRGRVWAVFAGYPCQPFSTAGNRQGSKDPRHLWPHIHRAVDVIRPAVVFLENVEGHVSLGLREVLADLVGIGYRVENSRGEPTWGLFSAAEAGGSHQRKRVFILAVDDRNGFGWRAYAERWIDAAEIGYSGRVMDDAEVNFRRGEFKKGAAGSWRTGFTGDGQGMANSSCNSGNAGNELSRWKKGTNLDRSCEGSAVEHSDISGRERGLSRLFPLRNSGSKNIRSEIEKSSFQLAYASSKRLPSREQPGKPGQKVQWAGEMRSATQQLCQSQLADTNDSGFRSVRISAGEHVYSSPPGPGDAESWARILSECPSLAPATEPGVRGMVDGLAVDVDRYRVDRLRMLGNGVHQGTAALAWMTLWQRMLI